TAVQKHYYPLNTLSRLSGRVHATTPRGADGEVPGATAWLTLFSAQPFGTTARETAGDGARMEGRLHRHLTRAAGRGPGRGVDADARRVARLLLTLSAEVDGAVTATAPATGAAASATGGPCRGTLPHDDWAWAWSTRSVAHHHPLVTLHADLADVALEEE